MSAPTGNKQVDEFLAEFDARISDADTRHPPDSKERLKQMRPLLRSQALENPALFEKLLQGVLEKLWAKLAPLN
jgi:hypothetical protein